MTLSIVRRALALPLLLLLYLLVGWAWLLRVVIRALRALGRGTGAHIYEPIITARRFVAGDPIWTYDDLVRRGRQPASRRAVALARAESRVVEVPCPCGGDSCVGAKFIPTEAWNAMPESIRQSLRAGKVPDMRDVSPS